MKFKNIFATFSIITILSISIHCNKENDVLATYQLQGKQHKFLRKDLNQFIDLYDLNRNNKNSKFLKETVRQIILFNIYNAILVKEKLNNTEEYKYLSTEAAFIEALRYKIPKYFMKKLNANQYYVYNANKLLLRIKKTHPKNPKLKNAISKPLSKEELELQDKETIEKLNKIRNEIISGHITFTEAVKKYSEGYNKKNNGEIGYFTKNSVQFEIEKAAQRLRQQAPLPLYRNLMKKRIYQSPSTSSKKLQYLRKYSLVTPITNNEKNKNWMQIEYKSGKYGFIQKENLILENQKEEKKISLPIKTNQGWILIQLTFAKKMNLDDFAKLLQEKYKDSKNTKKRARQEAENKWRRIVNLELSKKMKEEFAVFGIDYQNLPSLSKKDFLQKKDNEYLFNNQKIKISKQELNKQLKFFLQRKEITKEELTDKEINQLFRYFLVVKINKAIAKKYNIFKDKNFQTFVKYKKLEMVSYYFKRIKWLAEGKITDKKIRKIYDDYIAKQKKANKGQKNHKLIPFKKAKYFIKKDLLKKIQKVEEKKLLKQYKFNLIDKEFE